MTQREILADIHALEEEMLDFERKYGGAQKFSMLLMLRVKSRKMKAGCSISVSGPAFIAPD